MVHCHESLVNKIDITWEESETLNRAFKAPGLRITGTVIMESKHFYKKNIVIMIIKFNVKQK